MEVGTEIAWKYCDEMKLPRFVLINKMERDNANFKQALASVQEFTETRMVPLQLPWGEKAEFNGVIDLIDMKAYAGSGKTAQDIPAQFMDEAEAARIAVVEAAAEGEDELLEKYLENGTLSHDELLRGLRKVILAGSFIPVFVSAGAIGIGIAPLLNAIIDLMPSPAKIPAAQAEGKQGVEELKVSDSGPLAAYVWKTTADPFVGKQTYFRIYSGTMSSDSRIWNQAKGIEERIGTLQIPRGKENLPTKIIHAGDIGSVPKLSDTSTGNTLCDKHHPLTLPTPKYPNPLFRVSVSPKTQADSAKISSTLTRLCEEDLTLSWLMDGDTNQTVLQGMGDQHIDVVVRRAESKFQVNLLTDIPRVPYRETITKKGSAMYRHKKQTGGSGQFGEVHLRVEPMTEGDLEMVNAIVGGSISASYIPAIEKGIRSVMKEGILGGYPVAGVRVAVFDGKEHPVDSKPIAFEIAGREAFKLAFHEAVPVFREPIMKAEIVVPEDHMGDIMGDLNTRRARILGMESDRGRSIVTTQVPLAEMQRYTTQLRSMTGGRGIFSMEFMNYEVVPAHIALEIVAVRQKELAEHEKG
jgi:elongation factor G